MCFDISKKNKYPKTEVCKPVPFGGFIPYPQTFFLNFDVSILAYSLVMML
jgi:hypothetical protein